MFNLWFSLLFAATSLAAQSYPVCMKYSDEDEESESILEFPQQDQVPKQVERLNIVKMSLNNEALPKINETKNYGQWLILRKFKLLNKKLKSTFGKEKVKFVQVVSYLRDFIFSCKLNNNQEQEQITWDIIKEVWRKLMIFSEKLINSITKKIGGEKCNVNEEKHDINATTLEKWNVTKSINNIYGIVTNRLVIFKETFEEIIDKCSKIISNNVQITGEKRFKLNKCGNKTQLRNAMKRAAVFLKNAIINITSLDCKGETCQICIACDKIKQSACIQMTFQRTNKAKYLIVVITINNEPKLIEKIKLGDNIPRCLDIGDFFGKICLKGIDGKVAYSEDCNFCLIIFAEKYNIACKLCAAYQDNKLKIKLKPKFLFCGRDDNGNIVQLDENGEDTIELDAKEFQFD